MTDPAEAFWNEQAIRPKGEKLPTVERLTQFLDSHIAAKRRAEAEVRWQHRCISWAHEQIVKHQPAEEDAPEFGGDMADEARRLARDPDALGRLFSGGRADD